MEVPDAVGQAVVGGSVTAVEEDGGRRDALPCGCQVGAPVAVEVAYRAHVPGRVAELRVGLEGAVAIAQHDRDAAVGHEAKVGVAVTVEVDHLERLQAQLWVEVVFGRLRKRAVALAERDDYRIVARAAGVVVDVHPVLGDQIQLAVVVEIAQGERFGDELAIAGRGGGHGRPEVAVAPAQQHALVADRYVDVVLTTDEAGATSVA